MMSFRKSWRTGCNCDQVEVDGNNFAMEAHHMYILLLYHGDTCTTDYLLNNLNWAWKERKRERFYIHVPGHIGQIEWKIQHVPTCLFKR